MGDNIALLLVRPEPKVCSCERCRRSDVDHADLKVLDTVDESTKYADGWDRVFGRKDD